ncbi:ABC transporter substrate-binding protein [Pseudonocardia hydrocarbonoxydans]|uniref:Fe3+-citrate ABC transporter substrate-binding protein n=2 Tax=Pseudonocardia hydrocarbonoxydans TaxID=76726 RepID=A0A4Y3WL17_9PSEU|nr:Fe3+-citrate ABC transporter substrate-binding protein [Pseudonocardia hydrocarbonoxydans]
MRAATTAAAAALAAALLAGCGAAAPDAPGPSAAPEIDRTVAPLEPALSVTDPAGTTVTVPAPPERIVCLSGLCDDIVVELGLTPAGTSTPALLANPALLGDAAAGVPTVAGSFGSEDVESIAALDPDLVIGLSGVHEGLRSAVEGFAPLWLAEPATWEESVGYLRALGALTGRVEQATAAEGAFRDRLADAVATARETGRADRTVVLMYGSADSIGVDTSASLKGHLLGQLFDYPFEAKGTDLATAATFSVEELLARQPDVALVYSLLFSPDDETLSAQLADNPVWAQIPAVRDAQVFEVEPRLWGSGRGTRSLTAVIDEALALVPGA